MRRLASLALFVICCSSTGCALMDIGRDITDSSARLFRPNHRGYRDEANDEEDYHDEWTAVGNEARGERSKDHESDGLTHWMESPKARAINRSLGVD